MTSLQIHYPTPILLPLLLLLLTIHLPLKNAFQIIPIHRSTATITTTTTTRVQPPVIHHHPESKNDNNDEEDPLSPSSSSDDNDNDDDDEVWLTHADMNALRTELSQQQQQQPLSSSPPYDEFAALHTDVVLYDCNDDDNDDEDENSRTVPSVYRFNRYSHLLKRATAPAATATTTATATHTHNLTTTARAATNRTLRWCDRFVRHLNLCPWALASLRSENGIRIKIVYCSGGGGGGRRLGEMMEWVVRESARELMFVTMVDGGEEEGGGDVRVRGRGVDANVGITFVVAVGDGGGDDDELFGFESFYEFCTDLEDRLFDEADEAREEEEEIRGDDGGRIVVDDEASVTMMMERDVPIGDEVTIAPFHPDWYFASSEEEEEGDDEAGTTGGRNPLDYEKKAPYPTISLVRTKVIEDAGEEATVRIGVHNERILKELGVERLEKLYNDEVLRTPWGSVER